MKINKKTIKNLYGAIVKKISPIEIAGGLVVSDSAIRYIRFNEKGKIAERASLRLPPGAVVNDKIIQNDIVVGALASLRGKLNIVASRPAEVVFSISSRAVYSQLFSLPELKEPFLSEAAELNIQMISPIDRKVSYCGYQVAGKPEPAAAGGCEFLGAFIGRTIIDDWIASCKAGGFLPIAIEFQALSITRAITDFAEIREKGVFLVLDIGSEGMNLIIIKNGNLYFDYFYPWKMIQGEDKSISIDKFKQILIEETDKVMNFALSKFNGEVRSIWVNAEGIGEEIILTLKAEYPKIAVSEIFFQGKKIPPLWLSAIGTAKRGTLFRSEDIFISLGPQQVIEEYVENQTLAMIKLWRKISVAVLCFFIFVFGLSNLFLRHIQLAAEQQPFRSLSAEEASELKSLRDKANKFNALITLISAAKTQENKIHPFISKALDLGRDIKITRLSYQDLSQPVVLNGNAPSAAAAMEFQKRLAETPNITEVQMPLASLTTAPGGGTAFAISFRISSLDF